MNDDLVRRGERFVEYGQKMVSLHQKWSSFSGEQKERERWG